MVSKTVPKETNKKTCTICKKEKGLQNFYISRSILFTDGRVSFCKDCLIGMVKESDIRGSIQSICRKIDVPFLWDVFDTSLESGDGNGIATIKAYMKNINSLPQYRSMSYDDSVFEDPAETSKRESEEFEKKIDISLDDIEITPEIILKWGKGYTPFEYMQLEHFYQDMINTHDITKPQHKKNLIQASKNYLDMDKLQSAGDWNNLERVSRIQDKLLASSGFRPIDQKNGADSLGLFSFGQVWAEIEREGFILPNMVEYKKDDIDYMLLWYIQFAQRFKNVAVDTEPPKNWREEVEEMLNG